MASADKLLDPTSPQSSYGTPEGIVSSKTPTSPVETPSSSKIPKPTETVIPDFEKIEVIPEKEDPKKESTTTATTTTTGTFLSTEQSTESKAKEEFECRHLGIGFIIFAIAFATLVIRFSLYMIKDYFFEVIIIGFSLMVCSVVSCVVKRGVCAKEWADYSPKFKSKPRGIYGKTPSPVQFGNPMEPRVPQSEPLNRLQVDVHRGAEVESSLEASGSSQGLVKDSPSSDQNLLSSSDDSKTKKERKEAKASVPSGDDLRAKSASPKAKDRLLNLLRRKS